MWKQRIGFLWIDLKDYIERTPSVILPSTGINEQKLMGIILMKIEVFTDLQPVI